MFVLTYPFIINGQSIVNLNIIDTIFIERKNIVDTILVGFKDNRRGGSVIILKSKEKKYTYEDVLSCYYCKEKGASGYTYGGFTKIGNVIGFCKIDLFGIDTIYIDFSTTPPIFLNSIHRTYDKYMNNYKCSPLRKMSILQYQQIKNRDFNKYVKTENINWITPFSNQRLHYQKNGKWLSNLLIADTINLMENEMVYFGFDRRDWCTIILHEKKNEITLYRNILYEDIDIEKDYIETSKLKAIKDKDKTIVFIQNYSTFSDSISIDFATTPPVYKKIIHLSHNSTKASSNVIIMPKVPVPITDVRTLYGDVYVYPAENKAKWFSIKQIK
jgi:hypothetical protein